MLAPLLALAMQVNDDLTRGSALYSECKTYIALMDRSQPIGTDSGTDGGLCVGYVSGFTEGANVFQGFCVPDSSRNGTAIRVYIAYMDKHPKLFDEPKSVGLLEALRDAYPCPAK
jgi:hypothetical protein